MNQRIKSISSNYSFKGKIWKHIGSAAWHFVSLPKALSKKIRTKHLSSEEGWGRLKAEIKIKNTKWKSAIWYDTKRNSYLLPIKAEIRKKENLSQSDYIEVNLVIEELSILASSKKRNRLTT